MRVEGALGVGLGRRRRRGEARRRVLRVEGEGALVAGEDEVGSALGWLVLRLRLLRTMLAAGRA